MQVQRIGRFGLVLMGVATFLAGSLFPVRPVDLAQFRGLEAEPVLDDSSREAETKAATLQQDTCQSKLDALDRKWDLRRDTRRAITLHTNEAFPQNNFSPGLYDYFEPEAVCLDEERFGSKSHGSERYKAFGDGPKFVCGMDRLAEKAQSTKDNCLIYNVGSYNEVSFESAVADTVGRGNCEIHTFDPTVKAEAYVGNRYSEFHEWGFGVEGKTTTFKTERGVFTFEEISLATAMKRLNHYGNRTIDIFKIDCEGCEFVALTAIFKLIASGEIKINQVQAELHGGDDRANFPKIRDLFHAADDAGMRVFHKEPNSWGCSGYLCIEYAFVSKEWLREVNGHYVC